MFGLVQVPPSVGIDGTNTAGAAFALARMFDTKTTVIAKIHVREPFNEAVLRPFTTLKMSYL